MFSNQWVQATDQLLRRAAAWVVVIGVSPLLFSVALSAQAAELMAFKTTASKTTASNTDVADTSRLVSISTQRIDSSSTLSKPEQQKTTDQDFQYVLQRPCGAGYCISDQIVQVKPVYSFKEHLGHGDYNLAHRVTKYLTKGGSLAPRAEPEYGESGYYDTYYGRVDPLGERATLAGWKTVNGFDTFYYSKRRARYINAYDLGFGRDMNCLGSACYVTNFSDPKGLEGYPVKQATVTMERMQKSGRTFIAFFVYDASGQRVNALSLDSEGPKAVPQACFACHKGYLSAGGEPYGGSFLPFDVGLMEDWPGKPSVASQLEELRRMNYDIWLDASTNYAPGKKRNAVIAETIEGWYGGTPSTGSSFSESGLPSNEWFSVTNASGQIVNGSGTVQNCATTPMPQACKTYFYERSLYKNVYARYCRTCHVAQGEVQDTNPGSVGVVFNSAALFSNYGKSAACSANASMPHAELTDDRFRNDVLSFTNGTSSTPEDILCHSTAP